MVDSHFDPSTNRLAIGVDIGGTKVAAGVVTGGGQIVDRYIRPTPERGEAKPTVELLCRAIDHLRDDFPTVVAVGVGAAGLVEWPSGHIRSAPNNAYRDLPLRELLTQYTGLPVSVENDANVAAAAEARFGSGIGYTDSITITVGTGVGGGIVIGDQLFRGPAGIGAEVGHLVVDPKHGARCGCGAIGCLEAMASGIALARAGRDAAAAEPYGVLLSLAGRPENVRGETVVEAARQGDPTAITLLEELGYWLGIGIASLVNIFDTQVIILAGGIGSNANDLLLPSIQATFERFVFARHHRLLPKIVTARLGSDAGVIGAAHLARQGAETLSPARPDLAN